MGGHKIIVMKMLSYKRIVFFLNFIFDFSVTELIYISLSVKSSQSSFIMAFPSENLAINKNDGSIPAELSFHLRPVSLMK